MRIVTTVYMEDNTHCYRHGARFDPEDRMYPKWPSIYNPETEYWCGDWKVAKVKP